MTDSATKGRGTIRMISGGIPDATSYDKPQPDPAIAWHGQVNFAIPAGSTLDQTGKRVIVKFTKRVKLVIEGPLVGKLNLVAGCTVSGMLTILRDPKHPQTTSSMTLETGGKKSANELCFSKQDPVAGTVWQKDVSGSLICIVRPVVEELPAPMAEQQPAGELAAAA